MYKYKRERKKTAAKNECLAQPVSIRRKRQK